MFRLSLPLFLLAVTALAQAPGSVPSPMQAFAATAGVQAVWTGTPATLQQGAVSATITPLVLADNAQPPDKMYGVRVDLASDSAKDTLYLDEDAMNRTINALSEIAAAVAEHPNPADGCTGAQEFWPLNNAPWNQYHELNTQFCGAATLVLYPRGQSSRFDFPGTPPAGLSEILSNALAQLKAN